MKRLYGALVLGLSVLTGQAQVTLSGVVRDSATREPLPFVNVFLANTTRGTTSDEAGRFMLNNVPVGTFDLLVSHVGYRLYQESVSAKTDQTLLILLRPQARQLKEVVVKARRRRNKPEDFQRFKTLFLGTSTFSQSCRIKNPDDVWVTFDPSTQVLSAETPQYLLLENTALGYRLRFYSLKLYCDYNQGAISYVGWPIFEELKSRSAAQRRRWERNRETAYRGSLTHFLKSLRQNLLRQEGFSAHRLRLVLNPRRRRADSLMKAQFESRGVRALLFNETPDLANAQSEPEYLPKLALQPQPIDSLREGVGDSVGLRFNDALYVVYSREKPDARYFNTGVPGPHTLPDQFPVRTGQASVLSLLVPRVEISPDGELENPLAAFTEGYWGFERMGEFLPLDYQPPTNPPTKE